MLDRITSTTLDRLGLEVQRRGTLANFLRTRDIDLVVDAGANLGQFAQSIRSKGYRGRILSYEPVAYVFEALKKIAAKDANWHAVRAALGKEAGPAEINVLHNHSLSSLLKPTELVESYNGGMGMRTESVNVITLDEALKDEPARSVLLKIDVQGTERDVLEGARKTLKRTCGLYLELPVRHLYEGSWTFLEALQYIDGLGFEPAQFRMVSSLPDDPASAVEFDSLFRRKA